MSARLRFSAFVLLLVVALVWLVPNAVRAFGAAEVIPGVVLGVAIPFVSYLWGRRTKKRAGGEHRG